MSNLKQFAYKNKGFIKRLVPRTLIDFIQRKMVEKAKWSFRRVEHANGVNYIGFIQGTFGLGQSCRLIAHALNNMSIPFTVYNYNLLKTINHDDHTWDAKITNSLPYNINLFHLNAPELMHAYLNLGKSTWQNRYNIGYWLWELEQFPDEWLPALNLVDEVWTPAEFISTNLRKYTDKPVFTLTYPMVVDFSEKMNRQYFRLPENKFLFLTMYDCNSTMARKNPIATINAFKIAFNQKRSDVGLVIKVNNPTESDLLIINEILEGYSNIYLIAETMTKMEVNSLIYACDSLVSLHRAEGYGLPLAEAMALGRPVIGTNWSANTEFMSQKNSCLVDFSLVNLEQDFAMYKKGSRWAEADVDCAAQFMNRLVTDNNFYLKLAKQAKEDMIKNNSVFTASQAIEQRIHAIYHQYL